jgi:cobalt/nickel transport system ATP-binding protein
MSHLSLIVRDISFAYPQSPLLIDSLSFTANEHESIGIIGANGAGKSTLLKLLVGLELPQAGSIHLGAIVVVPKTLAEIRRRIGYLFQDSESQLFMPSVSADVAFAPMSYGLPKDAVDECVNRALQLTNITHLKDHMIHQLSGGEKKLVSLATILALTPDIMLLDEPTITLDPRNRRNLIKILNQIEHLKIIATHDLDLVLDTCQRVIIMNHGKIVADGETQHILSNQTLLAQNGLELPLSLQHRNQS